MAVVWECRHSLQWSLSSHWTGTPNSLEVRGHLQVSSSICIPYALSDKFMLRGLAGCTADGNGITYNEHINVALAVAMPDGGLITPVLKDADKTDIYQLSRQWADLVKRARGKQLAPDEYSTGTFTISNLGMYGVDSFDAILPPGMRSTYVLNQQVGCLCAVVYGIWHRNTHLPLLAVTM